MFDIKVGQKFSWFLYCYRIKLCRGHKVELSLVVLRHLWNTGVVRRPESWCGFSLVLLRNITHQRYRLVLIGHKEKCLLAGPWRKKLKWIPSPGTSEWKLDITLDRFERRGLVEFSWAGSTLTGELIGRLLSPFTSPVFLSEKTIYWHCLWKRLTLGRLTSFIHNMTFSLLKYLKPSAPAAA